MTQPVIYIAVFFGYSYFFLTSDYYSRLYAHLEPYDSIIHTNSVHIGAWCLLLLDIALKASIGAAVSHFPSLSSSASSIYILPSSTSPGQFSSMLSDYSMLIDKTIFPREKFTGITIGVFFSWFLMMGFYHTYGAIQALMDAYPNPLWSKYKARRSDPLGYWDMLPIVLKNQLLMLTVMALVYYFRPLTTTPIIPSLSMHLFGIISTYILLDICFYSTHRLLHVRALYFLHDRHHRSYATVGLSGMYQDSLDYFLTTALANCLSSIIFPQYVHVGSVWVLTFIGSINSIHSHGCYDFPLMPKTDEHYLHHALHNVNYGAGLCDWLFGTMRLERGDVYIKPIGVKGIKED